MKELKLKNGMLSFIDDEDYEKFSIFNWNALKIGRRFYVTRQNKHTEYLHRIIMNCPKGMQVDHIDGNGLNNCKNNLRLCTNGQNNMNKEKRTTQCGKSPVSPYKGVTWNKTSKKWAVRVTFNNKVYCVGSYMDEILAAKMYDQKAQKLYGEFARLNFPNDFDGR
jgi:hypothetical protein